MSRNAGSDENGRFDEFLSNWRFLCKLQQTDDFYANYIMGWVELTILTNFNQTFVKAQSAWRKWRFGRIFVKIFRAKFACRKWHPNVDDFWMPFMQITAPEMVLKAVNINYLQFNTHSIHNLNGRQRTSSHRENESPGNDRCIWNRLPVVIKRLGAKSLGNKTTGGSLKPDVVNLQ